MSSAGTSEAACCAPPPGLVLIDTVRVFTGLFTGLAPLPALLRVALPEVLWSLCFACLLYPWFTWVRRRIIHFLRL